MPFTLPLLLILLLFPRFGLAWDEHGHRAISEAVQASLDSDTVKALARIAGTGDELHPGHLARLSMWPDEIRPLITRIEGIDPSGGIVNGGR